MSGGLPPSRAARRAARAAISELEDRGGFDAWWADIDEETSEEILASLAKTIEDAYLG